MNLKENTQMTNGSLFVITKVASVAASSCNQGFFALLIYFLWCHILQPWTFPHFFAHNERCFLIGTCILQTFSTSFRTMRCKFASFATRKSNLVTFLITLVWSTLTIFRCKNHTRLGIFADRWFAWQNTQAGRRIWIITWWTGWCNFIRSTGLCVRMLSSPISRRVIPTNKENFKGSSIEYITVCGISTSHFEAHTFWV